MNVAALNLTQGEANGAVARALQSVFGYGRPAARRISETANCNERTALDWVTGQATPGFVYTMRLIATVPAFAAEVRRMTGLETEHHPSFQREFIDLMRRFREYQDGAAE